MVNTFNKACPMTAPSNTSFVNTTKGNDCVQKHHVGVKVDKKPATSENVKANFNSIHLYQNPRSKGRERKSSFPQSETKQSFNASGRRGIQGKELKRNYSACTSNYNLQQKPRPTARKTSSWSGGLVSLADFKLESVNQSISIATNSSIRSELCDKHFNSKNECVKMKTARSELSLLEQKRQQWAKEKEELNGLWSPWGRHQESTSNSFSPLSLEQMQASYASPTNVVSSSYVANLGISPISQSHSECYLPPINSTIAQQPRQKAKVWNAEFQQEDYRYENDNPSGISSHRHSSNSNICQNQRSNRGVVHSRKASLPNYMFDSEDGHHNNSSNCHHQHHNKTSRTNYGSNNEMWVAMEEDAFTSDYYSGENNNVEDGQVRQEVMLKPTSRERSYQEEISVQKAIAIRSEKAATPRVFVHKVYAQNGEIFADNDGNQEIVVNTVAVCPNEHQGRQVGRVDSYMETGGRSQVGSLPRNHAMRSSLTIGVDASAVDAYQESDRREKEQWLNELEKQREEQRMRKLMEKEERRPRWGDRGIGVGHFWEPSDSENSHLPAPPHSRGKGSTANHGESSGTVANNGYIANQYHPGKSHTPPAWLERSLTRMQSSKSQPSLHDPDYMQDMEYTNEIMDTSRGGGPHHQQLTSSRSLNQSAIDLRNATGLASPTNDFQSERTFIRGQNVPIDPDTLSDRERKRLANQEHLEALKKQIEERQLKQKEEKEQRQKEEREQEMRMARQRELELQRLEQEKRGKIPVNGDMPNSIEDGVTTEPSAILDSSSNIKSSTKISSMVERASIPIHDSTEERDIEIVQRQSIMVVRTPSVPDDEEKVTTDNTSIDGQQHHHRPRQSRQDQCVMTDASDTVYERTLTPTLQRSRSLSLCRSIREFGTQTELSDGSTSSSGSGSTCGSGKDSDKNRSHNSLLDKKAKEKKHQQQEKKSEERPRWGSNPVKKQYIKQSEKDPNYITRMKRRQDRLKRMEERCARVDTGTESEDVSIPFHRIRQRRNEVSPQRNRGKGITPMKATLPLTEKTEKMVTSSTTVPDHGNHNANSINLVRRNKGRFTSNVDIAGLGDETMRHPEIPSASSSMKNSKSETHLNHSSHSKQAADILDRNFGSVVGISGLGTSEESSGFSTPFLPRRELDSGGGSTGSGTTGSGSGVQSPDLAYHSYQANKSSREDRKYVKMTSGRDSQSTANSVNNGKNKTGHGIKVSNGNSGLTDFQSPHKGFIHQKDFDEMPVKASSGLTNHSLIDNMAKGIPGIDEGIQEKNNHVSKNMSQRSSRTSSLNRGQRPTDTTSTLPKQKRKASISPQRKPKSSLKGKPSITRDRESSLDECVVAPTLREMLIERAAEGEVGDNCNDSGILDHSPNKSQQSDRPESPPVPALLKKMQMGLQPDETGRLSSLPTEFPDILAPLPNIPLGVMSPNPGLSPHPASRISSATSAASSASAPKIDIDIAVTRRNNPGIMRLFEAAEERIKQRQLSAIIASNSERLASDTRSKASFEADIGNISINLEPVMFYPDVDEDVEHHHPFQNSDTEDEDAQQFDISAPSDGPRLNNRSNAASPRNPSSTRSSEAARHEAFIASILNRKEVKEQLSARESELSEKGIIEFSIRLPSIPSNSTGDDDFVDEYRDPLLTERRRHTAQWLYGGQNVPQKQAILTNLTSLKKGIPLQQQEWKVANSDTEL